MTKQKIHNYVQSTFAPEVAQIPGDYDLIASGLIDSLGLVRLLAWCGDTFDLPMDEIDIDPLALRTIDAVTDLVESSRAEAC